MNDSYSNSGDGLTLLNNKEEDKEKKVVAIIITMRNGGTYDNLFTTVQQ